VDWADGIWRLSDMGCFEAGPRLIMRSLFGGRWGLFVVIHGRA
jgi:hypothetical protein